MKLLSAEREKNKKEKINLEPVWPIYIEHLLNVNCIEMTKIKKKEAENGPFFNNQTKIISRKIVQLKVYVIYNGWKMSFDAIALYTDSPISTVLFVQKALP